MCVQSGESGEGKDRLSPGAFRGNRALPCFYWSLGCEGTWSLVVTRSAWGSLGKPIRSLTFEPWHELLGNLPCFFGLQPPPLGVFTFLLNKVSYSPGEAWLHYVLGDDFEFLVFLLPFQVLGLQGCNAISGFRQCWSSNMLGSTNGATPPDFLPLGFWLLPGQSRCVWSPLGEIPCTGDTASLSDCSFAGWTCADAHSQLMAVPLIGELMQRKAVF